MCITDLDGTILNNNHIIDQHNLQALHDLEQHDVCRVAATGRSLYSLRKVITRDMPFEYIIFSTGAGLMDWKNQKILLARHIPSELAMKTFDELKQEKADFMFHACIPDNHKFIYIQGKGIPDFYRRIELYKPFAYPYNPNLDLPWQEGTQFLIVAENTNLALYDHYIKLLAPLKVVRTTSPIDHKTLWLEVFSPEVSKGTAVEYLAECLGIKLTDSVVVGNDFNDVDMLVLTPHAYVTANAPEDLKDKYHVVADYTEHGFAEAISQWMKNYLHI